MKATPLIKDGESLSSARYKSSGVEIATYDDAFGDLYISRCSMGVQGIVRAQSWEDAYGICEDEFFPEADETLDEIVKEYGFRREHRRVIKTLIITPPEERHPQLKAGEKFAEPTDYVGDLFLRWETVDTPDPEAWPENPLFQEGFGFRPNGARTKDKHGHAIYAKDLNGESLDLLTQEMLDDLGIELVIETEDPK